MSQKCRFGTGFALSVTDSSKKATKSVEKSLAPATKVNFMVMDKSLIISGTSCRRSAMRLSSGFVGLLFVMCVAAAEDSAPKPITPAEAAKKVDEKVTVAMLVKSTGGRSNVYLNSEEDFMSATNFTIFIGKDSKEKFKKAGTENPVDYYKQKNIEVTGKVTLYEKKPRIEVTAPEEIKVLEKAKE